MRILWVKANKILPVTSGGDIRSYHIARQLARRNQLTFLSYYDGPSDARYEAELKAHFPLAAAISTGKREKRPLARLADYLAHGLQPAPYAVSRFECPSVRRFLRRCSLERRADVVVCDFLDAAVNFPRDFRLPSILFEHNVEAEIWRRHWLTASNPIKRLLYRLEFQKMSAYEEAALKRFSHIIAVSEHDAELMSTSVDRSRITVVPTGVDLERFRPDPQARVLDQLVMFVGAMDWEPNIDAVEYFCREIWPQIKGRLPGARFRVVGRNPDPRLARFASESVEFTGLVPSVVEHLRQAAVVVVPLRIGGGTRLKIYEAMAVGKAVVSTAIGAEGLDVHHGRDILLADKPEEFAQAVVALLEDGETRRRYQQAARDLANQYDWTVIAGRFAEVLENAVATEATARESCAPVASGMIEGAL